MMRHDETAPRGGGGRHTPTPCTHRPPKNAYCIEPGVFFEEATSTIWISVYSFLGERAIAVAKMLTAAGLNQETLLLVVRQAALERFLAAFPSLDTDTLGSVVCGHPAGGEA